MSEDQVEARNSLSFGSDRFSELLSEVKISDTDTTNEERNRYDIAATIVIVKMKKNKSLDFKVRPIFNRAN
ncbi:hypothetical protein LEP1GSC193_4101 [Leptospira alstonii serovar Pingchang str. 80-412]|uniref:Uncharacterized protein n=2 Tax=Leptospira alstonii TaxID=28452 RepID=M6CYS6_9LEPT|nr:hypothetical protein LEP1GSC194_2876 [Leptospira alstonii serovar Sichuan str. 79601]EQA80486.1 hypothetical protein LEP1GSC193_4101 [Leptospira alstonii serovar Pingchang str. 80-412]